MRHISYGIICIHSDNDDVRKKISLALENATYIETTKHLVCHNQEVTQLFEKYKQYIKFLLISKKHSYAFQNIIFGRYNPHKLCEVNKLLNNMTKSELEQLQKQNIDDIWKKHNFVTERDAIASPNKNINETCSNDNKITIRKHVYPNCMLESAIKKIEIIKNIIMASKSKYDNPEWEIPKGRVDNSENILNCAKREFTEETHIKMNNYRVYDNIEPIIEIFKGTDNKYYIYVYFIALLNKPIKIHKISDEASVINFYSLDDCLINIRSYTKKRKLILYSIYLFLISNIKE